MITYQRILCHLFVSRLCGCFFFKVPRWSLQKLNGPSCWERVCFCFGSLYDFSVCRSKLLSMWKHGLKKQVVGRRRELGRSSETRAPVADGDGVCCVTSRVACGGKRERNTECAPPHTLAGGRGAGQLQTYSGFFFFLLSVVSVNNTLYFSRLFLSIAIFFFKRSDAVATSATNKQTSITICFMTFNVTTHCKYPGS